MGIEWHETSDYPTQLATRSRGRSIARLAESQHGVVALSQLVELGHSASAVRDWVGSGRLHRVHRGVYAVGHPLLRGEGLYLAAVLACGPDAVLSHRSCGAHWDLRPSAGRSVDVTTPGRAGRVRAGIRVHDGRRLALADVTIHDGIPCTTVARTLVDLAAVLDRRGLERAIDRAEQRRVFDLASVRSAAARAGTRRGSGVLAATLHGKGDPEPTRSELEDRFLELIRAADLPKPLVNTTIDGGSTAIEVDFLWPEKRLVVELDGHETHGTRRAFEDDRARDRRLVLAGYRTIRVTWRHLRDEPREVSAAIRALLAQVASPGPWRGVRVA